MRGSFTYEKMTQNLGTYSFVWRAVAQVKYFEAWSGIIRARWEKWWQHQRSSIFWMREKCNDSRSYTLTLVSNCPTSWSPYEIDINVNSLKVSIWKYQPVHAKMSHFNQRHTHSKSLAESKIWMDILYRKIYFWKRLKRNFPE